RRALGRAWRGARRFAWRTRPRIMVRAVFLAWLLFRHAQPLEPEPVIPTPANTATVTVTPTTPPPGTRTGSPSISISPSPVPTGIPTTLPTGPSPTGTNPGDK